MIKTQNSKLKTQNNSVYSAKGKKVLAFLSCLFVLPFCLAFLSCFFLSLNAKEENGSVFGRERSIQVSVLSNVDWTDTGLDIEDGQEIYFRASGGISLQRGNPMAYCDPDGYPLQTFQQPIQDKNIGALIGKVYLLISVEVDEETGEEIRNELIELFYIGSENRVTMPMKGHLFLGVNENVVADNAGEFKVTIYLSEKNGNKK